METSNSLSPLPSEILHLSLRKEWYELIESGEKKEEYREIKPFWCKRIGLMGGPMAYIEQFNNEELTETMEDNANRGLLNLRYKYVKFSYGYTKRTMLWTIKGINVGYGKAEWGSPENEKVFVISIGERIL